MKKLVFLLSFIGVNLIVTAQDQTVNGNLTINNGGIRLKSSNVSDPYNFISFGDTNITKWLIDYGTGATQDFRILKYNSQNSASTFLNLDFANNQFEIRNSNVGIGTNNPTSRFVVQSNSGQTESLAMFKISDASSDYFQITNATGSPNQFIPLIKGHHVSDNRYSLQISGTTSEANDVGGNALVNFDARRTNAAIQTRPLFTWTSYTTKMMTMKSNGYLGIGTTNPKTKLDVVGGVRSSYSNDRHVTLFNSGDGNSYMNIVGGSASSRFGFQVDGSSKMSIMNNGNVGIGTSSPDAKLAVKGRIHTQEVKVDLNGAVAPDYVFLEDYDLKTIKEVENYIEKEGHLPNIPSAKEMEQNGIELKTMNLKLLEKIEELTLYMIEQNKKTELLRQEILLLKEKNKELEEKIK